jgi:hypothetical protein
MSIPWQRKSYPTGRSAATRDALPCAVRSGLWKCSHASSAGSWTPAQHADDRFDRWLRLLRLLHTTASCGGSAPSPTSPPSEAIAEHHVAEAVGYRPFGRKLWG